MPGSIDIPIAKGWHVTVFRPGIWLLVVIVAGLAAAAVTVRRARS